MLIGSPLDNATVNQLFPKHSNVKSISLAFTSSMKYGFMSKIGRAVAWDAGLVCGVNVEARKSDRNQSVFSVILQLTIYRPSVLKGLISYIKNSCQIYIQLSNMYKYYKLHQ